MSNIVIDEFTNDQIDTWTYLKNKQKANSHRFSRIWRDGYSKFFWHQLDSIPHIKALVLPYWRLAAINGKSTDKDFFVRIARGIFNVNMYLRDWDERDYLPTRCRWHDTFSHLPLLCNKEYSDLLIAVGVLGSMVDNEEDLKKIARWYWYTFEFSLIQEQGDLKALGAGIISSPGETDFTVGINKSKSKSRLNKYDIENIIESDYIVDDFQTKYFVIEDLKQVKESVKFMFNKFLQ